MSSGSLQLDVQLMLLLFFQSLVIYSMVISLTLSFSHSELYGLLVSEAYSSISYLYFHIFHSFKEALQQNLVLKGLPIKILISRMQNKN